MIFITKYRIVWMATSDRTTSHRHVIIEGKSFEQVQKTIIEVEEKQHEYCHVFFDSIQTLDGVILWK